MRLEIIPSNRFRKDIKLAKKRGMNLEKLNEVVDMLANCQPLADKYRDHSLSGNFSGFRECHVEPDWLLIYRAEMDALELFLFRSGTHSDLY